MIGRLKIGRKVPSAIYTDAEAPVCIVDTMGEVQGISDQEIARRLVACWNACEGLPTETLENVPGYKSAIDGFHEQRSLTVLARNQRDELLQVLLMVKEAAIAMRGADFNLTTEQWETFHSVIAKATGQQP